MVDLSNLRKSTREHYASFFISLLGFFPLGLFCFSCLRCCKGRSDKFDEPGLVNYDLCLIHYFSYSILHFSSL